MHRLLTYYRQNRKAIWVAILFVVFIIAILQYLNSIAKTNKQKPLNNDIGNSSTNTTISEQEKKSIISNTGISDKEVEKNKEIVDSFIKYCNSKDIQNAYNMLTDECKANVFPSVQDFLANYQSKVFKESKMYNMQLWISQDNYYTYSIELKGDILSSGGTTNVQSYTDYYTIVETESGDLKLNINNYIGREEIGTENEVQDINIKVISKDMYIDYEIYNIEVSNKSNGTILLDSRKDSETVFLVDTNDIQYSSYIYEIGENLLRLDKNITRKLSIKFNKIYNPKREIRILKFTDIILNYENYIKGEQIESSSISINV